MGEHKSMSLKNNNLPILFKHTEREQWKNDSGSIKYAISHFLTWGVCCLSGWHKERKGTVITLPFNLWHFLQKILSQWGLSSKKSYYIKIFFAHNKMHSFHALMTYFFLIMGQTIVFHHKKKLFLLKWCGLLRAFLW